MRGRAVLEIHQLKLELVGKFKIIATYSTTLILFVKISEPDDYKLLVDNCTECRSRIFIK